MSKVGGPTKAPMNANYFLDLRLDMIANFYTQGSLPFRTTMADIEAGRPPYDGPFLGDDPEPPHQVAWQQSRDALLLMGAVSVSLLAGALQVFLDTMVKLYGNQADFSRYSMKRGWWGRHQAYFQALGLDFSQSGGDIDLLSAMILARNSVMHQEGLINSTPVFRDKDLGEMKSPFFFSPLELQLFQDFAEGKGDTFLFSPNIDVTEEKLVQVIAEVRKLTGWLETSIWEKMRSPTFIGPVIHSGN